jgi:transposase
MNAENTSSPFLPLPDGMVISSVYPTERTLTVRIACAHPIASCPLCQQPSERVHGAYGRTVADLPCGGRRVILALTVRKFVCTTSTCPQKIFTERLSELVQSYARMTNRLREALQALGFATCGEMTERLAPQLGMQVSGPTLLRCMRTLALPSPTSVHVLGIDDWAWKKGQTYGTILVDLDAHRPIELLPDRSTATVEAWLRLHPEVEWVSRDRGGNYAAAARSAAPQAQQVADKFHLLKNLREGLKDFLDRKQSYLPEMEEPVSDAIPAKAQGLKELPKPQPPVSESEEDQPGEKTFRAMSPVPRLRPSAVSATDSHKQIRRDNRKTRYDAVRTLYQQGLSKREIARRMGLARETVRKFIEAEVFPEIKRREPKKSILDPYKPYLLQRWQERCWNGAQLFEEIKHLGYIGSQPLLNIFIADLRKKHRAVGDPMNLVLDHAGEKITTPADPPALLHIVRRMSSTRASWLFVSRPEKLKEKHLQQIERIRAVSSDLDTAYRLSQAFVSMVAERQAPDLDAWLKQAEHSCIPELVTFAHGIRRDYAAVKATLSSEISNGQVEGQVHRLKLQKRQVYGRANFDLLRLRVLHRI